MRIRALTTARGVLLLAAAALLGLVASSALAQGTLEVQIEPPDRSAPVTLSLDDVEGSIDTSSYRIRDSDGNERMISITPENGAAVDDFLKAAGFDEGYTYLRVGDVRLSRMRVRSQQGASGLSPAIYVDEHGTHFVRPLFGPDDHNESDIVTVAVGALLMRQTVDSMLELNVKASKRKLAAGKAVTFEAEVRGGGVGDKFEYRWSFGDGSKPARTRRVEHSFEDAGSYRVKVSAETPDDIAHGSVRIEVGEPKESDVDREGGGGNEAGGAPSSGSYDGDSGAGSSYGSGATGSFDYSSDGSATDDYSAPGDYSTDPAPPASSRGPTVEGNLLADISTPPGAAAESAARAAREGTPRAEPVDPAGVPTAAWALGAALGLLGVGAGMESGRLRRSPLAARLSGLRARLRALLRR